MKKIYRMLRSKSSATGLQRASTKFMMMEPPYGSKNDLGGYVLRSREDLHIAGVHVCIGLGLPKRLIDHENPAPLLSDPLRAPAAPQHLI